MEIYHRFLVLFLDNSPALLGRFITLSVMTDQFHMYTGLTTLKLMSLYSFTAAKYCFRLCVKVCTYSAPVVGSCWCKLNLSSTILQTVDFTL